MDLHENYQLVTPNFENIKYFLIDMDGSFYIGNTPNEGSITFIEKIIQTGRDFLFLTNNSSGNAESFAKKLRGMGVNVGADKILTTCETTSFYLNQKHPGARLFVIGNHHFKEVLFKNGFDLVEENPDFLVVGFDTTLTWDKLKKACLFAERGVPYIATNPDPYYETENGMLPDCGAITAAIEAVNGVSPLVVIGKPHNRMVEAALARLSAVADKVAMCGDRLPTDMVMAIESGLTACLLLCGETTWSMVQESKIKPTYVFRNLGAMIPYLK